MSATTALVVLVAALCVLNLILTVGLIRRVREHSELLSKSNQPGSAPAMMRAAGERVGSFSTVTLDGESISDESLVGEVILVGAFAHGCSLCAERLPEFLAYARTFPRARVLAVLVGAEDDLVDERRLLEPVSRIVLEDRPGGEVTSALGVKGYPAFAVFNADGTVRASGTLVEHVNVAMSEA